MLLMLSRCNGTVGLASMMIIVWPTGTDCLPRNCNRTQLASDIDVFSPPNIYMGLCDVIGNDVIA